MFNGNAVTYDADGNMTGSSLGTFAYDSANRLTVAGTTIYTYDVENIRVKKCIGETITEYTHNANSKLSQLLMKTENNVATKYVYGLGLIYETTETDCKVYHFDYRGSTVALTNLQGSVTDTFQYDTYGKLLIRTGTTNTPFLYNGRDGVMSNENGLVYMRARYYSPTFKRFINADVVAGSITNAITLNRYAYANGNPVSNVDPFGLSPERGCSFSIADGWLYGVNSIFDPLDDLNALRLTNDTINFVVNEKTLTIVHDFLYQSVIGNQRPNNIGKGIWNKQLNENLKWVDDVFGTSSKIAKSIDAIGIVGDLANIGFNVYENIQNGTDAQRIITDAAVDATTSFAGGWLAGLAGAGATALATKIGAAAGTAIAPGVGTLIGAAAGVVAGGIIYVTTEVIEINGKSAVEWVKEGVDSIADSIASWFK